MLSKTEDDFRLLDIVSWVYHHFLSADISRCDEQIHLARAIINEGSPSTSHEMVDTWEVVVSAMSQLPWPVCPLDLTKIDLELKGLGYWIGHFYSSEEMEICDEWHDIACGYASTCGDGCVWDTWQKIASECEAAEVRWKERLKERAKAVKVC